MPRSLIPLLVVVATAPAWARMVVRQSISIPGQPAGVASVYLPAAYDGGSDRYPVLVLLHGLGGAEEDWRTLGNIEATLDRAIAGGVIPPLIALIPDGRNGYWSDWPVDRPGTKWESLVEPAATRWLDGTYRTNGVRAIAGVSMGGFGALSIALRNSSRYVAVLSFSGALFTRTPSSKPVYWSAFGGPRPQPDFIMRNPLHLARLGRADRLAVWLDCGREDAPKFTRGLAEMARALESRGADVRHRLRPGTHTWGVWNSALAEALPWLGSRLAGARVPHG